jgi:Sigma-70, region 4
LQLTAEWSSDAEGPLAAGSTAGSRLRSIRKYVRSAEHRLAEASRHRQALLPQCSELALVRAELRELVGDGSLFDGVVTEGLYSRSQTERLLLSYLWDREAAAWTRHASDWRDVGDTYEDSFGDDHHRAGLRGIEGAGISVVKPPRSRNVFDRRVAVPSRGTLDGSSLPRGPGPQVLAILRRADLQRAIRSLSPRAGQVLFLRAVVGLEFKEVGGVLEVSAQAAHKAYGKALGDLAKALNGLSGTVSQRDKQQHATSVAGASRLAELRGREVELSVVVAELAYWQRRAEGMEALLEKLRPRLEQALDEVESQTTAA